jgi:hypothetical protein
MKKDRIPSRDQLQQTINELGFDLTLAPDFSLSVDQGFVPMKFKGDDSVGFELFRLEPAELADFPHVTDPDSFGVSLLFGSSMQDAACALIVGCALAKECDAQVSYEDEEPQSLDEF